MIVTLFDRDRVFHSVLPNKITGRYVLETVDENQNTIDLIAIEADEEKWYVKSNKNAFLQDSQGNRLTKCYVEAFKTYTIHRDKGPTALLYIEPPTDDRNIYTKHTVKNEVIRIGRGQENHICFSNKLVSGTHCMIKFHSNGHATIQDQHSANGTYVNGRKIREAVLSIGDVIYIMGLKIIYNNELLTLNNPHGLVLLDRKSFEPFKVDQPIVQVEENLDELQIVESNDNLFFRSPRFKRDIRRATIKIDPPPQPTNMEETPLMLMLGPSITMGMASLFTALFMLQNVMSSNGNIRTAIPMLVMSVSMLIGMILWPILTKRYEKKKKRELEKKRQEKYIHYLEETKNVIEKECQHQEGILRENHVSLEEHIQRINKRERNLWERAVGQNDFLKVRIGLGDVPLDAEIKYPEKKFTLDDDNLQEELYKLADTPKMLRNVPVTLSLIEEKISGVIGNRDLVKDFVKGLIIQLTTLHSYDELKLVFIYDEAEQEDWAFIKWLPHVWTEDKKIRFIATDLNEVKELSNYFEKEIMNRAELTEDDIADLTQHYVVFSMSKSLASKAEMINLLVKEKKDIGFSLLTLYDQLGKLPKECSKVVELQEKSSKIYDKDDISGSHIAFNADMYTLGEAEDLAIKLANIGLSSSVEAYALPSMLTFLEMFGVSKIEHLNALTRWKENNPTLTIETQIGVDTSGDPFKLDLHEKYHGPHGLIAGMTGSGKSEFIMTFILSLAVNYHPNEVAFILIDYKGGGMANAFLNLPHLAGTITNLDGAAVKRSLVSIQSELKRRQAIFSETSRRMNESNIDIYKYQKLYREGKVSEPLQHLFMISDEFAELKTQQPEFMEQLVSAARIGRSLGVHLILATQKPSGVVDDQIWSNSKFRISLKVQEKADSMEVIKRPDAAELSTTGRFYLQVGYNELFELGQSAWAGAPYIPTEKIEKSQDTEITVIDHLGRVIVSAKEDKNALLHANPPKQIDEITNYLAVLAEQEHVKVKQLWLEPIAAIIYLEQLKEKYQDTVTNRFELNPVIGEYDDPANQRQMLMRLPITEEGNTIIYGVAGSGKTTFLSTMIYSLMEEHSPEEVNLYLLDFSSETLSWFKQSPHVGDVILSHESEKIGNLFKMANSEITRRKKLLSNYGGDFKVYNQLATDSLPSIIIAIHNFSAFTEMYEEHEESISYLTREGLKYGIYFIVTALNTSAVRYKLLQNFKQMYVLQLNDTTEYSGVLGSVDGVYPSKHKGRGIFKNDTVYEFQTAHISEEATRDAYTFTVNYCQLAQRKWNGVRSASRIPTLPEAVDLDYLQEEIIYNKIEHLPIGVERSTLQTSYYNFTDYINLVLSNDSPTNEGFIKGLVEMYEGHTDDELIVIDMNETLSSIAGKRHQYVCNSGELESIIVYLFTTLVNRNNSSKEAIEEGREAPAFKRITCIIDSFSDMYGRLSEDGKDKMKVFLERGDSLNVHFIINDRVNKLTSMSYESWFKKQVSLTEGIWLGNGISEQYLVKVQKVTPDMYKEIPEDFGYVITKGKPVLVKLLSKTASAEEVAYYG
ncbi:type VII secretion protein EssC [Bacillus sp. BGMRC 2118]|nr:type VII secretion protein EssC [Bacillus sp. BGMRC 2118]